jgi:hypothetical protein
VSMAAQKVVLGLISSPSDEASSRMTAPASNFQSVPTSQTWRRFNSAKKLPIRPAPQSGCEL